MTHSVVSNADT